MQKRRFDKVELLAPAGDLLRAKTAIRYGADAVYIGGKQFSLRSRASNFSLPEIQEACAFAKENHAKIFVTVNEIPHQEDFEGLKDYLVALQQAGVAAVIVASPSIMAISKQVAPKMEVHCSTQMNVTNSGTIAFLKESLGIDRVVLARECSLDTMKAIVKQNLVDSEVFIHGGMCVNYSGQCTLSNLMTLRDANRGGCAQSCRWSYQLYEKDAPLPASCLYTMGSKDLCAVSYLKDLMEIGVTSLKIEGRMKTEYYVASMVSAYRHCIDDLYEHDGTLSSMRMEYHEKEIRKAQNRQSYHGLLKGERAEQTLITHENSDADVNHDFVAVVEEGNDTSAWVVTRNPLRQGDTIEVLSPGKDNRSFVLTCMQDENGEILSSCFNPMKRLMVETPFSLSKGDILRKA